MRQLAVALRRQEPPPPRHLWANQCVEPEGLSFKTGYMTLKSRLPRRKGAAEGVIGRIDLVPVDGCYAMYTRTAVNKLEALSPPHHLRIDLDRKSV